MDWRTKYLAKLSVQKVLGSVPGLYRLQEAVKRGTGRWQGVMERDFVLADAAARIASFERAGLAPPGIVVEQGTGWHGLDLVLFALAGARRLHTYDTTPWLRAELLGANLGLATELAAIVERWPGVDRAAVRRRALELGALRDAGLEVQLEALGVRHTVTRGTARTELADRSVDLFYSNSVLQRVVPRDLDRLLAESARFLRPGGQSFHIVDSKDFHAITDRRVPEIAYLAWGDVSWKALTSRYLNYQNRLRAPQFVELFERAGLAATVTDEQVSDANVRFVRERLARDPRYADMAPEQVAVTRFELLATVPADASAAA